MSTEDAVDRPGIRATISGTASMGCLVSSPLCCDHDLLRQSRNRLTPAGNRSTATWNSGAIPQGSRAGCAGIEKFVQGHPIPRRRQWVILAWDRVVIDQ